MYGCSKLLITHTGSSTAPIIKGETSKLAFTFYMWLLLLFFLPLWDRFLAFVFILITILQWHRYNLSPLFCRKFRYIAYRQLVRWCWGYLGKHVRVALPSCAVNKIRNTFPADFGSSYTGLKPPSLWEIQRYMLIYIINIHVLQH